MLEPRESLNLMNTLTKPIAVDVSAADWDAPLDRMVKAVLIGVSGDLSVQDYEGNDVIISSVPEGIMDIGGIQKIYTADTTASDITVFCTTFSNARE